MGAKIARFKTGMRAVRISRSVYDKYLSYTLCKLKKQIYQAGYSSGLYVNLFKHIKRNDYVGVISHDKDLFIGV